MGYFLIIIINRGATPPPVPSILSRSRMSRRRQEQYTICCFKGRRCFDFFSAQGQQGNGNPCGPRKVTCHAKASCVNVQGLEECRCKGGYQGDGTKCEGMSFGLFITTNVLNTIMTFF